jgi:hypothetical protein
MHGVRAMWGKKSRRGVQIGEYRPHTYIGYLATTQLGSSTGRIASEVTGVEVTRAPELTVLEFVKQYLCGVPELRIRTTHA